MNFQKGAFLNEAPLILYGLKFNQEKMMPSITTCGQMDAIFLHLCKFKYDLTVHYTNTFDPYYSIESRNLQKNDGENNFSYIVEDVRHIYKYAFSCRPHKITFTEQQKMQCELVESMTPAKFS